MTGSEGLGIREYKFMQMSKPYPREPKPMAKQQWANDPASDTSSKRCAQKEAPATQVHEHLQTALENRKRSSSEPPARDKFRDMTAESAIDVFRGPYIKSLVPDAVLEPMPEPSPSQMAKRQQTGSQPSSSSSSWPPASEGLAVEVNGQ